MRGIWMRQLACRTLTGSHSGARYKSPSGWRRSCGFQAEHSACCLSCCPSPWCVWFWSSCNVICLLLSFKHAVVRSDSEPLDYGCDAQSSHAEPMVAHWPEQLLVACSSHQLLSAYRYSAKRFKLIALQPYGCSSSHMLPCTVYYRVSSSGKCRETCPTSLQSTRQLQLAA